MSKSRPNRPLTIKDVENIAALLFETTKNLHIQKVTQISRDNIYLSLSRKDLGLLISLNAPSPFLMLAPETDLRVNTPAKDFSRLTYLLTGAQIKNVRALDNDRIIKFNLERTTKSLDKEDISMYVELITSHPNLIICDDDDKVIYAFHYALDSSFARVIKLNEQYPYPKFMLVKNDETHYEEDELIYLGRNYLNRNYYALLEENNSDLYQYLFKAYSKYSKIYVRHVKEINKPSKADLYIKQANLLLTYQPKIEGSRVKVEDEIIKVDPLLSSVENANVLFAKAKKEKRTLEYTVNNLLPLLEQEIEYYSDLLKRLEKPTQKDVDYLREKIKKDKHKQLDYSTPSFQPYFVVYDGVKIGFGKNAIQNDFLTFRVASKNHTFLHIDGYAGSHVIVFDENPSEEILYIAACLALLLSKKETAKVIYTKVANLKRNKKPGLVTIKEYKEINADIDKCPIDIKELLEKAERF